MIYGFFGDVGSGKTLSMTKYGYLFYKLGYNVYSNYRLAFPHTLITYDYILEMVENDLELTGKNVFLLDEVGVWMDSRLSGTKRNRTIGYFSKQVRKKDIKLLYSEQMEHAIDKRLRGLTKTKILCTTKELLIHTADRDEPYIICVAYNEIFVYSKKVKHVRYCGNPFFKLYDTKELVKAIKD